tara:strand:- start:1261 stop:1560 length:300 start_codon:yes stop_codon:yes gene_type:complete
MTIEAAEQYRVCHLTLAIGEAVCSLEFILKYDFSNPGSRADRFLKRQLEHAVARLKRGIEDYGDNTPFYTAKDREEDAALLKELRERREASDEEGQAEN